jgi:hypothetical protein
VPDTLTRTEITVGIKTKRTIFTTCRLSCIACAMPTSAIPCARCCRLPEPVNVVDKDILQLYENWFIETCQDWVVPYFGDLVDYIPAWSTGEPVELKNARSLARERAVIPRREVANTVRFLGRKGTLAVLKDLVAAEANWPARAIDFGDPRIDVAVADVSIVGFVPRYVCNLSERLNIPSSGGSGGLASFNGPVPSSEASCLRPNTITTHPSRLNLITMSEPLSVTQILSSRSTLTVCA